MKGKPAKSKGELATPVPVESQDARHFHTIAVPFPDRQDVKAYGINGIKCVYIHFIIVIPYEDLI